MRILHVYSGNLYGGIETFLRTLARIQGRASGLVQEFALCFEGRLSRELREAGAVTHLLEAVKVSRPWTVWRARSELARLLERGGYTAVVCHAAWPQAIFGPVVRASRVPLVFHQHDALNGRHWLERWARVTRPELIISNSRFSATTLASVYPEVPYEVRYYPVLPLPPVEPGERERVRVELGAQEHEAVILQSCRMEAWKGHRLLLDALGQLKGLPGWVLWVAGGVQRPAEADYLAELETQAARLGIRERVRFLGQRTDVPRLLRGADLHCQPNLGPEPFGLAFIEALQAGLPVVTTAMGAPLETIDSTCGVLVPPAPEALAQALQGLIQEGERRRELGAGGPARAEALCAPEVFLSGLASDLRFLEARARP